MRVLTIFLLVAVLSLLSVIAARSASCGIGSYDFTQLTPTDWVGLGADYSEIYYLNLCQAGVQNLWCQLNPNTAASQVCQVDSGDTESTFSLMSTDTAATNWSYINGRDASDGVQFAAQTGEGSGGCPGGKNRAVIGQLVCGNSSGIISSIVEQPPCTYTLTLPTPTVCQKGSVVPKEQHEQVETVRQMLETRLERKLAASKH
jgi:hypothetical protein